MDETLEGRTGEPFTMVVELGKIREFARATKSRNAAYSGQPGERPVIPVTFLMASSFWQTEPQHSALAGANINWSRILHGEQEFVYYGEPPRAGDVLTGIDRVSRVYDKAGKRGGTMTFIERVTEFRNDQGDLVAESRSTLIETSKPPKES